MTCDNCGGGDNNIHITNPDPTVTEVVVDENIVLHPQPGTPYSWCIQDLKNVTNKSLQFDGLVPFVWDPETCFAGPGVWPCPQVNHWDSSFADAPPEGMCEEGCNPWSLWVDDADGLVTHFCIDGEMVELGGQGSAAGGECCGGWWSMVDGNCDPVLVMHTSEGGWRFYNGDLVSIARPADLDWPSSCQGGVTVTDNGDGTLTITSPEGSWVVGIYEPETCCYKATDADGDLILVAIKGGNPPSFTNLTSGGSSFVAPLEWVTES